MSYDKVFKLVDKFVALAEETSEAKYQTQREMLDKFYDHFHRNLRAIVGELGSEIRVLKERQMDAKILKMMAKLYQDLVEIAKELNIAKPYTSAEKLVTFVLKRPGSSIVDNLDFLAKQHLQKTNVDFPAGEILQHPQMRSLDKLKALAVGVKDFMDQHPLVVPPSQSQPPPARLTETMGVVPSFLAGKEEVTRK